MALQEGGAMSAEMHEVHNYTVHSEYDPKSDATVWSVLCNGKLIVTRPSREEAEWLRDQFSRQEHRLEGTEEE